MRPAANNSSQNPDLVPALTEELRRSSTWTVLFHQAVAERAGLHATDHRALDLLLESGPITAGRLAELTGLTTGAITGVVDRLEKAGYVRREKDPGDRRRVIIRPLPEKSGPEIGPLFGSLAQAMLELCTSYSQEELETILDFASRSTRVLQEETVKLRKGGTRDA